LPLYKTTNQIIMVRVRFAPSPTGPLHIGGVRTALYNYLFARQHKGELILRIEDTDQARYVPGAEDYIIKSLAWVGIDFDEGPHIGGPYEPYRQSDRKPMYKQYAQKLLDNDLAYYAFDSSDDLENMRKRLEASKMLPKYDAISRSSMVNSLTLSKEEVEKRLANGDDYVIRLKLPRNEEVRFQDEIRGWVVVNTTQMDDKVLLKSDGMPTYHLANVVDDYLMKITHVIRGEEWLPSAPLHVLLYRYLGWEENMPAFAHLPLLLKPDGNGKLSKRDGDRLGFPVFPLQWTDPVTKETSTGYKDSGYLPEAVINMLALLGWHGADNRELYSKEELIEAFDIKRVSKSGAKFDLQKAHWFNQQYISKLDSTIISNMLQSKVAEQYPQFEIAKLSKAIDLTKEKAVFIDDCINNAPYLFEKPTSFDEKVVAKKWNKETLDNLNAIKQNMESIVDWNATNIENCVNAYAESKGEKPSNYFQVLRLALTGVAGGPPLFDIMSYLGKLETLARIEESMHKINLTDQL